MRDRRRIQRILTVLQKIWEQQPDVRFNQLLSNLQSVYSQRTNNYGRREVFKKEFIDLEKTFYLDFFFLEDDKWEEFLNSYWSTIEQEIDQSKERINEDIIEQVIQYFIEAGIEKERLSNKFKEALREFFAKESRWLTAEAVANVVRNFSTEERKELFRKIKNLEIN